MSISVCIASRGRPALLSATLSKLCEGMTLPDTQIAVALDDDDDAPYDHFAWDHPYGRVCIVDAEREDSLGAKFNRAKSMIRADIYVLWADDMVMPKKGWDASLERAADTLPDKCGIVLFGAIPGVLQPGIAMTAKFIEAQGFFCPSYFPYWWSDTWPLEIATLAGCFVSADVEVSLLQEMKGKSQNVREISFWGTFFDATRPLRRAVAEKLIRELPRPDNVKAQLLTSLDEHERRFLASNRACSDPENAKRLEGYYADGTTQPDARYLRLKAKAEKMMEELNGR